MRSIFGRVNLGGRIPMALVLAGAVAWLASRAESQQPPKPAASGVLSVLKPKQNVALRQTPGGYELSLMPDATILGQQVVEVGSDYIVIRDTTDIAELRIPIYSIKVVITQQRL